MSQGPHRQSLLLPIVIPLGALAVIGAVLFGFSRILLGISHTAATVTACVVAVVIMIVAAVVAGQKRVGPSAIGSMLGVVTGVTLMTGSLAFLIVGPQVEEVEAAHVTVVAGPKASAEGFEQTQLTFPADEPVDLEFDNQEQGVEHNVDIYREDPADSPGETPLLKGAHTVGPAVTTYAVSPLPEGEYVFLCEVHPATMTGSITAAPGGAAPGPTVVASGIAFDTKRIELPEQTQTALTFDNQDAGTIHNIAIYTDDSLQESLFDGEDVVGPATATYSIPGLDAGTFYFLCDTHPTMNGSVEVAKGPGDGDGGGGEPSPSGEPPPSETPTESPPPPDGGGPPAEGSISAASLAFDTSTLTFPADTPISLAFDNQDAGVLHNVAIYQDQAFTQPSFSGEHVTGPTTVTYDVPPLAAATYYFRCDVHPTMTGTVSIT